MEMLAVGRELLIGRTVNTNARWMGARLAKRGSLLSEITTVDDDLAEIAGGLRTSLSRKADYIVVVGGLGPTPDDMTLKGIALATGRPLRLNAVALRLIREHYRERGLGGVEMTPARKKMATLPTRAAALPNPAGTAPGVRLAVGSTKVFCLPGVPSEMKAIFRNSVEPLIANDLGNLSRAYIRLKVEGIYESALAPLISRELRRHPGAYIKSHPKGMVEGRSRIDLDIAVVDKDRAAAEEAAWSVLREMKTGIEGAGAEVTSEERP